MPRKAPKFKIYDGQAQFCAGEGIHPALARRAKAENCRYFKPGGRIDCRAAAWIRKQGWDEKEILNKERLECQRIEKQNRKLDLEHQIKLEKYVLRTEAQEGFAKGMEIVQNVLETFLDKTVFNKAVRELKRRLEAMDL